MTAPTDRQPFQPSLPHVFGRYVLNTLIAQTDSGDLFKAVLTGHSGFRKDVAIQVLPQNRELPTAAASMGRLRHPNIVDLYDFGECDGHSFVAMELVEGITLTELTKSKISREAAIEITHQIGSGLNQAEAAQMFHPNLKMANIVVTSHGVVKIPGIGFRSNNASTDTNEGNLTVLFSVLTEILAASSCFDGHDIPAGHPDWGSGMQELGALIQHFRSTETTTTFSIQVFLNALEELPGEANGQSIVAGQVKQLIDKRNQQGGGIIDIAGQAPNKNNGEPDIFESEGVQTNLVSQAGRFVGRESELEAIRGNFEAHQVLVTLKGPAGTGKTRLANRFGFSVLDDPLQSMSRCTGVIWCDLTEARNASGIIEVVALAMDIQGLGGSSVEQQSNQLGHAMNGRGQLFIIFDNMEHVVDVAGETLSLWIKLAPNARFLVTSRERLRLPEETVLEIPPLPLRDAMELFVDRAHALGVDLELNSSNRSLLADIAKTLDCIPLALELAAARTPMMGLSDIQRRMANRFRVLGKGSRGVHSKQATLQGAIAWSWNLLTPHEQDALAQCAVFRGGFSTQAAEAVIDLSTHETPPWVIYVIDALIDKSLLFTVGSGDGPDETRLGLYESIREFALQHLDGERRTQAERRHAEFFVGRGLEIVALCDTAEGKTCMQLLARGQDNLLAVAERFLEKDPPLAADAVLILERIFPLHGLVDQYITLLDRLLQPHAIGDLSVHAHQNKQCEVFAARARVRLSYGNVTDAKEDFQQSLMLARKAKNPSLEARALVGLAKHELVTVGPKRENDYAKKALKLSRESKDQSTESQALMVLGDKSRHEGQTVLAEKFYRDAIAICQAQGSKRDQGIVLSQLGNTFRERGQLAQAEPYFQEALQIAREFQDRRGVGMNLANLGILLIEQKRLDEGESFYRRALSIYSALGARRLQGITTGNLAILLCEQGRFEESEALYRECLAVHREGQDATNEGISMGNFGILRLLQGRMADAERCFRDAVHLLERGGNSRGKGYFLCYLGAVVVLEGKLEEADHHRNDALEMLQATDDEVGLAMVQLVKGHIHAIKARMAKESGDNELAESEKGSAILVLDAMHVLGPSSMEHPVGTPSMADKSEDVRFLVEHLEKLL